MAQSAIEWTQATWNPVTGCAKVSPGCKHCYAEALAARLRAMGQPKYRNGFQLTLHPDSFEAATFLEKTADYLCELNERFIPRKDPGILRSSGISDYASRALASVSGLDQTG